MTGLWDDRMDPLGRARLHRLVGGDFLGAKSIGLGKDFSWTSRRIVHKAKGPNGCLGYLLGMNNYPVMWGI